MKISFKIMFVFLAGSILFSACKKTESSEVFDMMNFSDDTTAAAQLVEQANQDLNKIKVMYKKNEVQREELIAAMGDKDTEKVKKITDDLVYLINDGMSLGESAVEKIGQAQQKNINADFKDYLSMKEESLRKQLAAFEHRRQAVRLLRDSFGTNDPAMVEKAKLDFKQKEELFAKTMEESKEISKKASEFAKESSKKIKE